MKKQTPFLDFYKECLATGKIPNSGLCYCRLPSEVLDNFEPTNEEKYQLVDEGTPEGYWGCGFTWDYLKIHGEDIMDYGFTPMRETIVLLCAAINEEL